MFIIIIIIINNSSSIVYVYIYIYREREREREIGPHGQERAGYASAEERDRDDHAYGIPRIQLEGTV